MHSAHHYSVKSVGRRLSIQERKQQGFLLIEAMIAMFILAIGVLGMASLQTMSIRYVQNAYFISQANIAVADMADRMRINKLLMVDGGMTAYQFDGSIDQNVVQCISPTALCTAAQLASYELHQWQQGLQSHRLPLVKGLIDIDDTSSTHLAVIWDQNRDGQLDHSCSVVSNDGCVELSIQL